MASFCVASGNTDLGGTTTGTGVFSSADSLNAGAGTAAIGRAASEAVETNVKSTGGTETGSVNVDDAGTREAETVSAASGTAFAAD